MQALDNPVFEQELKKWGVLAACGRADPSLEALVSCFSQPLRCLRSGQGEREVSARSPWKGPMHSSQG